MGTTSIEWTDETWNPTVGCTRVSPGCKNCYAFALHDMRHDAFLAGKTLPTQYAKPFSELQLIPDRLADPLKWKRPRRVFVNSVSDLFHEDVPDEFIDRVFAVMASASTHIFQVLTKRPWRMREYFERVSKEGLCSRDRYVKTLKEYHEKTIQGYLEGFTLPSPPTPELRFIYDSACEQEKSGFRYERRPKPLGHGFSGGEYHWRKWPLSNVWLGVSVEDQKRADQRIPHLLATPAAVRFLSVEPMLGPIEFSDVSRRSDAVKQLGRRTLEGINWIIVGGESGPNARPFDVGWARSLRDQCKAASVAFFLKQLGSRPVTAPVCPLSCECGLHYGFHDKKAGDPSEWPADLRIRQFPGEQE
jgi:protein gp37